MLILNTPLLLSFFLSSYLFFRFVVCVKLFSCLLYAKKSFSAISKLTKILRTQLIDIAVFKSVNCSCFLHMISYEHFFLLFMSAKILECKRMWFFSVISCLHRFFCSMLFSVVVLLSKPFNWLHTFLFFL